MPVADFARFDIPLEAYGEVVTRTLRLFLLDDGDDNGRVILYGDRDKLVYEGHIALARDLFDREKDRYQQRIKAGA